MCASASISNFKSQRRGVSDFHKPERPSDLSFSSHNKRQGFVFNNNWNLNKNKF